VRSGDVDGNTGPAEKTQQQPEVFLPQLHRVVQLESPGSCQWCPYDVLARLRIPEGLVGIADQSSFLSDMLVNPETVDLAPTTHLLMAIVLRG